MMWGLKETLEIKWKQTQVRTCQDSCLHSWPKGMCGWGGGMWSIRVWGRILSLHDSQHVSVAGQQQPPWTPNSDWKYELCRYPLFRHAWSLWTPSFQTCMGSVDTPFSHTHGLCKHLLFTHTWVLQAEYPHCLQAGGMSYMATRNSQSKHSSFAPYLMATVSADQIMSSRSLAPLKRKRCWLKGLGEENQNWLTSVVVWMRSVPHRL